MGVGVFLHVYKKNKSDQNISQNTSYYERVPCVYCNGYGKYINDAEEFLPPISVNCPNCNGKGTIDCSYCKGAGYLINGLSIQYCPKCNNTKTICPNCNGRGFYITQNGIRLEEFHGHWSRNICS